MVRICSQSSVLSRKLFCLSAQGASVLSFVHVEAGIRAERSQHFVNDLLICLFALNFRRAHPGPLTIKRRLDRVVSDLTYIEVRILVFQETKTLGTITVTEGCRGGGMADAVDLKSIVRKDVRVRLPPSAPYLFLLFSRSINLAHVSSYSRDPVAKTIPVDTKRDEVICNQTK